MNNNPRESFIKALEANEDDKELRLVFADWLEENAEYEEAQRQRKWIEVKESLVQFFFSQRTKTRKLAIAAIEAGKKAMKENAGFFTYRGKRGQVYVYRNENQQEIWERLSFITGIPLVDVPNPYDDYYEDECGACNW